MKKTHLFAVALILTTGLWGAVVHAADQVRPDTVLKLIKSNKDLSKFADLIDKAGIEDELIQKDSMVTVFAPSNDAMSKISSEVMKKAKSEKDGLKSLARYHMITGSAVFGGNIKGRRAGPSTANGEMVGFDGMGKDLKVNDSVITTPDLVATNGVVHILNAPLIPLSLNDVAQTQAKEAQEAQQKKMDAQMKEREAKVEAERSKIEAERAKVEAKAKAEAKTESKAEVKTEPKVEPKVEVKTEPKVEVKTEPKVENKVEPKVEPKAAASKESGKAGEKTTAPVEKAPVPSTSTEATPPVAPSAAVPAKPEEKKSIWKKLFGR